MYPPLVIYRHLVIYLIIYVCFMVHDPVDNSIVFAMSVDLIRVRSSNRSMGKRGNHSVYNVELRYTDV